MFNKKGGIIAVAIFLVLLIISIISMFTEVTKIKNHAMFNDINECYSLEGYTIIENPKDKYVDGLDYEESFVATVKNKDCKFKIFAYEFNTSDDAWNYYAKDSKKKREYGYFFSTGHSTAEYIVFNGKNLYRISCSSTKIDDVSNYLSTVFTLTYKSGEGFAKQPIT